MRCAHGDGGGASEGRAREVGVRAETDEKDAGERVAALARRVNQKRRFFLAFELALGGDAFAECAQALAEGLVLGGYEYLEYKGDASPSKLKKNAGPPELRFVPTRDILAELAASARRPDLLIGFAAETERVVEQAVAKRTAKQVDWIVANDVSGNVMGGHRNRVHLITAEGVEDWPEAAKDEVAGHLMARIAEALG